ncbi:MAG: fimbrial assembly protein FimA, partial [Candidatus Eremiobacteraeota bacterium]|nr:fimbrial assembly protein FimA [Candidatus Eremiobacteraeota bacterium]
AALAIEKPGGGYAGFNDRYVDLRVDDHAAPIEELARILELHKLYFFAPEPADLSDIDETLGAEIVRELARIGALASAHAPFDAAARDALVAFMHVENLENRVREDGRIDAQTLRYLRAAPAK